MNIIMAKQYLPMQILRYLYMLNSINISSSSGPPAGDFLNILLFKFGPFILLNTLKMIHTLQNIFPPTAGCPSPDEQLGPLFCISSSSHGSCHTLKLLKNCMVSYSYSYSYNVCISGEPQGLTAPTKAFGPIQRIL